MVYYPKSQVKTNLYTNGAELIYKASKDSYVGEYFKTSTGKYYTGKNPNFGTPSELIVSNNEFDNIGNIGPQQLMSNFPINLIDSSKLITPVNDVPISLNGSSYSFGVDSRGYQYNITPRAIPSYHKTKPTNEQFQLGKYTRYFCKKNNELIYIEISQDTYNKLINRDPLIAYDLYTPANILWQSSLALNYNAVLLIEQNLKWYGFSQYFKGNFES
jgi:hypothetical protein